MVPRLVIVGRPNVGKSSLVNMLARRRVAIVDPTAGVTRDRVRTEGTVLSQTPGSDDRQVELIDTGGYGIADLEVGDHGSSRDMTADVERQITRGLAEADLVLFVVDGQAGITALDEQIARMVRRQLGQTEHRANQAESDKAEGETRPVILVVNKVDADKHEAAAYEAAGLGFETMILVSAETGHRRHELHEAILDKIHGLSPRVESPPSKVRGSKTRVQSRAEVEPAVSEGGPAIQGEADEDEQMGDDDPTRAGQAMEPPLIAVVGKRNAGKSTLVNALAEDQQVIVSEQPGTTRDAVDVPLQISGQSLTLIDTAGFRREKSISDNIEFYSHHRALRSIRRADVCLLLIDATTPISQVDRKLAGEIVGHHRPVVIVVTKWDLADGEHTQGEYAEYLDGALKGLSFAPIVFTSARRAEGLREAIGMGLNLYEQARHRIQTAHLNQLIETITTERGPSSKGGKRARIYYATQPTTDPPTLTLFVNDPDLFDSQYQRYLMNRLRDDVPFSEVPIRLRIRARS